MSSMHSQKTATCVCLLYKHIYFRQGGYVLARLCFSVCVLARWLKKLCMDLSEIFWECREW